MSGIVLAGLLLGACGSPSGTSADSTSTPSGHGAHHHDHPQAAAAPSTTPPPAPPPTGLAALDLLPGMPPPIGDDVYAATREPLGPAMSGVRNLVYVPNGQSDTVSVIDPTTFQVVDTFPGGDEPQHVIPSYDMQTLYVVASMVPGGTLTPIDPRTGEPGDPMPIDDPYNLYFTPDGQSAIVVAEAYRRLDFYDPHTWQLQQQVSIPECEGINHMDFTADGRLALVTCEFANKMVVLDVAARERIRTFDLDQTPDGMPQDSRLAPNGQTFYVADMHAGGIYLFNGDASAEIGFIPTGAGAHGLYFSRDSTKLYISNRDEGSVSVLDTATNQLVDKWWIPGGGSPDMGSLSTDGSQLWLAGRYHNEVYVFDTNTGQLITRIPVGSGPHGLTYMPQPGRYSLGHTSNIR